MRTKTNYEKNRNLIMVQRCEPNKKSHYGGKRWKDERLTKKKSHYGGKRWSNESLTKLTKKEKKKKACSKLTKKK